MSQIKISQLPIISTINANTANTLFAGVDVGTGITGQITAHTLAQGLFSNEVLNVGLNPVLLQNTVGQFSSSNPNFIQINLQNFNSNGASDMVLTADNGNDIGGYIDLGINNSTWNPAVLGQTSQLPYDGYLIVDGPNTDAKGNLVIGTANPGTNVVFAVAGQYANNIVAKMTANGLSLNTQSYIVFGDNTVQTTAGASNAYAQAAFAKANTAVQNTAIVQLQALTLTGNLIANSAGQGIFVDTFTSNNAIFSKNVTVLSNLTANTLLGNVFFSNVVSTTSQSNSIIWFPQASTVSQQVGQLWYYSNTQSLILDTDIAGDRLSISKVLFFRAYNSTGATIPANSFVRLINGVTANQIPYIALADATSSANATVAGFVKNPIANGAYGFAYSQGIVEDLNSTGLGQNGDILFLSTTPGVASNVAPQSGISNTVVQLGRIILNDAVQGKLYIQNQLRQAYGRTNGSVLYAYANNITSSNTLSINDATGYMNVNNIVANTYVFGSATANSMVTQLTNKSTAVTANGTTGQITMNNAGLGSGAYVTFTVNNSYVQHVNDVPFVAIQNPVTTPNPYQVSVGGVRVGSFDISIINNAGGGAKTDAIVLNWALMRVGN
jgi:hypothetical protein